MTQTITCRYTSYETGTDAGWWRRLRAPVCEQFGWRCGSKENAFEISTEHPQMFLDKNLVFARQVTDQSYEDAPKFQPRSWTVGYGPEGMQIALRVREIKSAPLVRVFERLTENAQLIIALVVAEAVIGAIGAAIYVVAVFPEPSAFWNWVADHARVGGALALAAVVLSAGSALQRAYDGSLFAERFIFAFTVTTFAVFILAWLVLIPVRGPSEPYADYLNNLRVGIAVTGFISLTPWLVVVLKAIGLDPFGTAAKFAADQLKPGK